MGLVCAGGWLDRALCLCMLTFFRHVLGCLDATTFRNHPLIIQHHSPLLPPPTPKYQVRSAKAQKQLEEAEAAARAADPSIYDYDGVYDTMQAERQERAKGTPLPSLPSSLPPSLLFVFLL